MKLVPLQIRSEFTWFIIVQIYFVSVIPVRVRHWISLQEQVPICGRLIAIPWCVTLSGYWGWLLSCSNYFLYGDIDLFRTHTQTDDSYVWPVNLPVVRQCQWCFQIITMYLSLTSLLLSISGISALHFREITKASFLFLFLFFNLTQMQMYFTLCNFPHPFL